MREACIISLLIPDWLQPVSMLSIITTPVITSRGQHYIVVVISYALVHAVTWPCRRRDPRPDGSAWRGRPLGARAGEVAQAARDGEGGAAVCAGGGGGGAGAGGGEGAARAAGDLVDPTGHRPAAGREGRRVRQHTVSDGTVNNALD